MRHVCILGTSETTWRTAPFADPSVEMWAVSSGWHLYPRVDRFYELHYEDPDPAEVSGIDAAFWTWAPTEMRPIYMIAPHPRVPASVAFPLEAVIAHCRDDYFTCSIALMIGQAMLEGVEKISLYGVDLSTVGEYAFERPCVEYWIGKMRGMHGDDAVEIAYGSFVTRAKEIYGYRRPSRGYYLYAPTNFGETSCILHGVKIHNMFCWQYTSDEAARAAIQGVL